MRLLLAVVLASIAFTALFVLATSIGIPRDFAAAFAAPVFAAVPLLQRRAAQSDGVVFVYAVATSVAALALGESLDIVSQYVISEHPALGVLAFVPPTISVALPLLFLIGAWIGSRSSRWPLVAAVVAALAIVMRIYEVYVVPPSPFELAVNAAPTFGSIVQRVLTQAIVWSVPLALGFWCGRASRKAYPFSNTPMRRNFL